MRWKAQTIRLIFRLTDVDIGETTNGDYHCVLIAESKLHSALIRQKLKSNSGSARYDFNLHLAQLDAIRALVEAQDTPQNKTGTQLNAECR